MRYNIPTALLTHYMSMDACNAGWSRGAALASRAEHMPATQIRRIRFHSDNFRFKEFTCLPVFFKLTSMHTIMYSMYCTICAVCENIYNMCVCTLVLSTV